MTEFAERVRFLLSRRRRGDGGAWTQEDLAKAVGVERNTVSGWLNRGAKPRSPIVMRDLARALGTTVEWLFGDDDTARTLSPAHAPLPQEALVELYSALLQLAKEGVSYERLRQLHDLATGEGMAMTLDEQRSDEEKLRVFQFMLTGLRVGIRESAAEAADQSEDREAEEMKPEIVHREKPARRRVRRGA